VKARLLLELDASPLERMTADVAAVPLFSTDRPLRGAAGRADWRLQGRLSRLLAEGRLSGARGEAVLVESGGPVAARYLLALGLGSRADLDGEAWRAYAGDAVRRARGLGAGRLALALPECDPRALPLRQRAEALLAGAGAALAEQPAELALALQLGADEAPVLAEALRAAAGRVLPEAVGVALPAPAPRPGAPAPAGERLRPALHSDR